MVRVQWGGEGYVELIEKADKSRTFAVYDPPSYDFETIADQAAHFKAHIADPNVKPDDYPGKWVSGHHYVNEWTLDSTETKIRIGVPMQKCPWVLPGEPEPIGPIFEDLRAFVKDHVDFRDDRLFDIVTAWIMSTWVIEAWDVIPYLFLLGPKASGKTRVLEVLNATGYRPVLSASTSEAALYQLIETHKTILLLDEAERYTKDKGEALQQILNSGYRRGQLVTRANRDAESGERTLETFEVFGFKALSGTKSMLPTLESRSIVINMAKSRRKVAFRIDAKRARGLRSRLLSWRWTQLNRRDELNTYHAEDAVTALEFGDGRFVELFAALYAGVPEARLSLLTFARDTLEQYNDEEAASIESDVTVALLKIKNKVKGGRFAVQDVVDAFNEGLDYSQTLTSEMMGHEIKKLGLHKKKTQDGRRGYVWDEDLIHDLARRFSVPSNVSGYTEDGRPQLAEFNKPEAAPEKVEEKPAPKPEPAPSLYSFEADALAVLCDAEGSMGEVLFMRGMKARGHNPATVLDRVKDLDARGVVHYSAGKSVNLPQVEEKKMIVESGKIPKPESPAKVTQNEEAPD